jgi:hypothetical protein
LIASLVLLGWIGRGCLKVGEERCEEKKKGEVKYEGDNY